MTDQYKKLLTPLKFNNGQSIKYRTCLTPMVTYVAEKDGSIGDLALKFYGDRSDVAGLLITGAANVVQAGKAYERQINISDDKYISGLTRLAKVMKADGNKAVVQLHHGGKEAMWAQENFGHVESPSGIDFPAEAYTFPSDMYQPEELTENRILEIIAAFAAGAKRAMEAGFDGVEIHGANQYLLQSFFSAYTNRRTDKWGGSLENRMRFPIEVVKAVKEATKERPDFIIGYRFSPEETLAGKVGYTMEDSLQLADKIADLGVSYIHTSIFSRFDAKPKGYSQSFGELVKNKVGDRAKTIIVSGVHTADDAKEALDHADIIALGREALVEPQFTKKIAEGKPEEIKRSAKYEQDTNLLFTELGKDSAKFFEELDKI
ncbi:hypothetical protein GNF18_07565 [Ligilactobacillus pobuzihii]|uniref:oxidoreductase n=1 Tax=Ligilactobacillus pobuzihii TaxID=449659 RepID=UPI0019D04F04|nr:NADH-dependent oxidoreductase [Ligilactobacillus pobuzihii]MBN7274992.1 hypothetical protein [Ligilactobacillus pobuzihii]